MKIGEFLREVWNGNEPEEFRPATQEELAAIERHRPVQAEGPPMVRIPLEEPSEIDLGRITTSAGPDDRFEL